MRSQGSARELEQRRQLAVARVSEGYSQAQVAAFLGVHRSTVSRWVCTARAGGADALAPKPTPGRPRKLTARQEKTVLGWITRPPTRFGFAGDLWTSRRLATLIEQRLGVHFTATTWWSGCACARTRRKSPSSPPRNAASLPSPAGSKRTGRACKKKRGRRALASC